LLRQFAIVSGEHLDSLLDTFLDHGSQCDL
jgi:hypothetical protein